MKTLVLSVLTVLLVGCHRGPGQDVVRTERVFTGVIPESRVVSVGIVGPMSILDSVQVAPASAPSAFKLYGENPAMVVFEDHLRGGAQEGRVRFIVGNVGDHYRIVVK